MQDADRMNDQKKEIIWQQWRIGSPMSVIGRLVQKPPATLEVETDLFGTKVGESKLKVTAKFGKASETVILSVDVPSHIFSRSPQDD